MSKPDLRIASSAQELIQDIGIKIEGITFYGVSSRLSEEIEGVVPQPDEIQPTYSLKTFVEPEILVLRLLTQITANVGVIEVDVAIAYRTAEPVQVSEPVLLEFANEVGIMALLPFVREAVADLSTRVFGNAILMPVMQRGELHFESTGNGGD